MKKIAAALIALIFILGMHASAFQGSGYPAYDGESIPDNQMAGNFAGSSLLLEFDPAGDYSFAEDGIIQACFFAFDESETHYIELYLALPADIGSGDSISSSDFLRNIAKSADISLYEVHETSEDFYYAGAILGMPYPSGSGYEISISEAEISDTAIEVSGSLSAMLVRFEGNDPTEETLALKDIQFHFLLPVGEAAIAPQPASPDPEKAPDSAKDSLPNFNPAPAITLPPDYITL